ncbi:uncharacterized protein LOC126375215 [Pectinophora gossypiella]|uniref:uncharacterized protein LOC126375215 n=1 Tax=Pectinophora gossypiella TaxID=13191 RepID=UPI00214E0FC1|nr:uncharacterized protein LOC126375215 [Pectinophora gossypiella]
MKRLIVLLATVCVATGIQYDGLRVKFGWSDALADVEYFYKIPRSMMEAEAAGWRRTSRPSDQLPDLRMYCMANRCVCALYDVGGFVAGLQIALPVDEFEALGEKPEMKMNKWRAQAAFGEPSKEYWVLPQFFVSDESLKAGAGPQIENGATLQDGGVWVYGLDARLMRIPTTEAELNTTAFKKQNCIPNMGTHYYYNMTPQMRCEDLLPWFVLVSEGEVIGSGFQFFGKLAKQRHREWFEKTPGGKTSAKLTIPYGPPCLYEWAQNYGLVSLHIYYVDKPWNIRCKDGDSIKPAPALDRMLLNGYRYASQITDQIKKLFSG